MFARLTAKAIFAVAAIAMAFFGIGLLGMAIASALVATLGVAGSYAAAGAILQLTLDLKCAGTRRWRSTARRPIRTNKQPLEVRRLENAVVGFIRRRQPLEKNGESRSYQSQKRNNDDGDHCLFTS